MATPARMEVNGAALMGLALLRVLLRMALADSIPEK